VVDSSGENFFCCICVLAFSFFLDSTCMVISSGLVLV